MFFVKKPPKHKKILCLDFDGVLHSYSSGWQGPRNIPDPPVPGALEFLIKLARSEHFCPAIFSSRSRYFLARRAMKKWLYRHLYDLAGVDPDDRWYIPDVTRREIPQWLFSWISQFAFADPWPDEVHHALMMLINKHIDWPTQKPPAFMTIDDRAITFEGEFPEEIDHLLEFRPWNNKADI